MGKIGRWLGTAAAIVVGATAYAMTGAPLAQVVSMVPVVGPMIAPLAPIGAIVTGVVVGMAVAKPLEIAGSALPLV